MLGMRREDLAVMSKVAHSTLSDFEAGRRQPHPRTLGAIRTAFETAGIEFIPENGGGAGVRLRKPTGLTEGASPPPFAETIATALDALPTKAERAANEPYRAPGTAQEGQ